MHLMRVPVIEQIFLQHINTIAYGMVQFSLLRRGGGGHLSKTTESEVKLILIDLKFGTHN